ncbi:hypothetical protein JAAARDRAFT_54605 [Jaapia argillacea MUCL 33604]|uniref:Uncharacterized protein n=1 Tax=Jaapia argillacea MUCL 33604 TaxID=933084 RepID=A0A067QGQ6_9AGAM|nr:hypothetical protein JAAARDRAFT_54605 [Jaapia argillacea MUCL 33604]
MTASELWLTYHQASRAHSPATSQLIELEFQNHKLADLEDVLDYVFAQGFVDPKHRPVSWWEKCDGVKVKGSQCIEELLIQGAGKTQETALKLVIADRIPAIWFSYVYLHNPGPQVVSQRIKLDSPLHKFDKLAHLTNHIFNQGYLPPKFRTLVHWEGVCGKKIEEHIAVEHLLCSGEGICEEKALRLVIDHHPCPCF